MTSRHMECCLSLAPPSLALFHHVCVNVQILPHFSHLLYLKRITNDCRIPYSYLFKSRRDAIFGVLSGVQLTYVNTTSCKLYYSRFTKITVHIFIRPFQCYEVQTNHTPTRALLTNFGHRIRNMPIITETQRYSTIATFCCYQNMLELRSRSDLAFILHFAIITPGKTNLATSVSPERSPGRTLRYACLLCDVVFVFPKSNKLET